MNETTKYPAEEFLRDYKEWADTQERMPDHRLRAKLLFGRRYRTDLEKYVYRLNRFICITMAVGGEDAPKLLQDLTCVAVGGRFQLHTPHDLLLALLDWYIQIPESGMDEMPTPDWAAVMSKFDEIRSRKTKPE